MHFPLLRGLQLPIRHAAVRERRSADLGVAGGARRRAQCWNRDHVRTHIRPLAHAPTCKAHRPARERSRTCTQTQRTHTQALRYRCGRGEPSPDADVGSGEPSPGAGVAGVSPVPVKCGRGERKSRCRCCRGDRSRGADAAGVSPVSPGADVAVRYDRNEASSDDDSVHDAAASAPRPASPRPRLYRDLARLGHIGARTGLAPQVGHAQVCSVETTSTFATTATDASETIIFSGYGAPPFSFLFGFHAPRRASPNWQRGTQQPC